MAREEHERLLRAIINAGWPEREPGWPAFLEGGVMLRVMDADANWWMPRALRTALHQKSGHVCVDFLREQPDFVTDAFWSACQMLKPFCHALVMCVGGISPNWPNELVCGLFVGKPMM